jgi:D-alanine-D-alanine ligase
VGGSASTRRASGRKLRVLLIVRKDLVPRNSLRGARNVAWRTEYDVRNGLRALGHEVRVLAIDDDAHPIVDALREWRPAVVFNLVLDLRAHHVDESHIVSALELCRAQYTGCDARALMLTQDKAVAKRLLASHGIPTPRFEVCSRGNAGRAALLSYPLIVKPASGGGSAGIAQRSVVKSERALRSRLAALHDADGADAIVEEYVDGRELTIGVLGNGRPATLPIWETFFRGWPADTPRIATYSVKWSPGYRRKRRVTSGPATNLPDAKRREIADVAARVHRAFGLSGFARIDLRLDVTSTPFVIDVNPNPDVGFREDFARSAKHAGIDGPALLQKIVDLALRRRR